MTSRLVATARSLALIASGLALVALLLAGLWLAPAHGRPHPSACDVRTGERC